jgi:3'-phosphoadenosine 5'-phosphosulfate sulfotransferase
MRPTTLPWIVTWSTTMGDIVAVMRDGVIQREETTAVRHFIDQLKAKADIRLGHAFGGEIVRALRSGILGLEVYDQPDAMPALGAIGAHGHAM